MSKLVKLKQSIERKNRDGVAVIIKEEMHRLNTIIGRGQSKLSYTIDKVSEGILPAECSEFICIKTTGNGNCLYNAASLEIKKGDEYVADILRCLVAADIYTNARRYADVFRNSDEVCTALSAESEKVYLKTTNKETAIQHEALLTCGKKHWSSLIHMIGLSNVLKRPVRSVYPESNFHLHHLYNKVYPPFCVSEAGDYKPLCIMWTVDGYINTGAIFSPNHFILLKPKEELDTKLQGNAKDKNKTRKTQTLLDFFKCDTPSKRQRVINGDDHGIGSSSGETMPNKNSKGVRNDDESKDSVKSKPDQNSKTSMPSENSKGVRNDDESKDSVKSKPDQNSKTSMPSENSKGVRNDYESKDSVKSKPDQNSKTSMPGENSKGVRNDDESKDSVKSKPDQNSKTSMPSENSKGVRNDYESKDSVKSKPDQNSKTSMPGENSKGVRNDDESKDSVKSKPDQNSKTSMTSENSKGVRNDDESKDVKNDKENKYDINNNETIINMNKAGKDSREELKDIPEKNQPVHFDFPKRKFGKKNISYRKFCAHWFSENEWLHYDENTDSAFCYTCMQAYNLKLFKRKALTDLDEAWISKGYTNWKHPERISKHGKGEAHLEAVEALDNIKSSTPGIDVTLNHGKSVQQEKARKALLRIISNIRYLARQGLAFRGDRDEFDSNFIQLNRKDALFDSDLNEWLSGKNTYESPEIQNEIIDIMAKEVLRGIVKDIRGSEFFAILANETSDNSDHEQLVIFFRWVDNELVVHEDLVGLYLLENTLAETIYNAIKDVLIRLNLSISKCRGQSYDGASNMSGRKTGVQSRFKAEEPRALFNHCDGHKINLACFDCIKGSKVLNQTLDTAIEIINLVKKSPVRNTKLEKLRKQHELEENEPIIGIRRFCPTRWTVKADGLKSIIENYQTLDELWDWSLDNLNDVTMKSRIKGVQTYMEQFDFFFGIHLSESLLRISDNLSSTLQNDSISAAESKSVAMKTVETLRHMRSDSSFELFWETVNMKAQKARKVRETVLPRKRKTPARFEEGSEPFHHNDVKDRFRQMFFEALDLIINSISTKIRLP